VSVAVPDLVLVRRMRVVVVMAVAGLMLGVMPCMAGTPALSHREVIRLSDAFARKEGVDLAHWKRPVVRYHHAGDYWTAYYAPIPNRKGLVAVDADFSVRVDDSRVASDQPLR
jgi:hypothetical protein